MDYRWSLSNPRIKITVFIFGKSIMVKNALRQSTSAEELGYSLYRDEIYSLQVMMI